MTDILSTILVVTLIGYGFHRMMQTHMILNWYRQILIKASMKELFNDDIKEYFGDWAMNYMDTHTSKIMCSIVFVVGVIMHIIWYSVAIFIEFILYLFNKPLGKCMICNTTWIGFIIAYHKDFTLFWIIVIGVASTGSITLLQLMKGLIKSHTSKKYIKS